jgi:threonine synthase
MNSVLAQAAQPGLVRYVCTACDAAYGLAEPRWRCDCGGTLELNSPPASLADIDHGRSGVWRYASLLPSVPAGARVSLGEQTTPLLKDERLGVHLKLDYLLPSGSYKDRGATVLASRLKALGVKDIVMDSSGNAGAAMSTYCAAAGIQCQVFVPADNSPTKLAQVAALGGKLRPVDGSRLDATKAATAAADQSFYASHNWSPDFGAGLATVAFELWEQLDGRAPSSVLAPCGNGGIILGLFRGFDALKRGGLIDRLPRLIAVQSAAFDSVTNAIQRGLAEPEPRGAGEPTIAEGIACSLPVRGRQLLDAIRVSAGSATAVSEAEIVDAAMRLASSGVFVEPTGSVGLAGLMRLRDQGAGGLVGDAPVVILTGNGLKSGRKLADLRSPGWWVET